MVHFHSNTKRLKIGLFLAFFFLSHFTYGQTLLFREGFNTTPNVEPNGATNGMDEFGTTWSTTCPSCNPPTNNTFQKQGVRFECHNSKGLGTWTTASINVSQTVKLEFSLTYASSLPWAGSGNMESNNECSFGNPCTGDPNFPSQGDCDQCWDFINVELILDGTSVYSETVGNGNNLQNYTFTYNSPCHAPGTYNSAVIRVKAQNWSSDEYIYFDDVILRGYIQTPATLTLNPIGPYCVTDPTTVPLVATPTPGTWSGPGVMANTFSPSLAGVGTHTLTYSHTSAATGNCPITEDMQVVVNPAVTPTFTQPPNYCVGATIPPLPTTSNNGITGTWSPAIDNSTTTTYTFTPVSTQCATPTTITITITDPVTPTFNQPPSYCVGATIPPLPTTSTNGITGVWNPAIDNSTTTTYTFTAGAMQCATNTTITITITDPVVPTFTQPPAYCAGATIPPLPTTSNNGITGAWTPAIDNSTTTTYTFNPGPTQCATATTITINIDQPVVPDFGPIGPFCLNSTPPTLPGTSPNNIMGTWNPTTINTSAPGSSPYLFTPNSGICATTQTINILINNLPVVDANPVGDLCLTDAPVNLVGIPAGGTWSGTGVTGNTFDPANAGPGSWSVTYTFTDGAGCTNSDVITINVSSCGCANPVIVNAGPDDEICDYETITLSGIVTNTSSYAWTSSGSGVFSNANILNPTYTPSSADIANGTVTLTLTGADPDGAGPCAEASDVMVLTINESPQGLVNGTTNICRGECVVSTLHILGGTGPFNVGFTISFGATTFNFSPVGLGEFTSFNICYTGTIPSYDNATKTINIPAILPPGQITLSMTSLLDTGTGCNGTFPAPNLYTINLLAPPTVTINPAGPLCTTDAPVTLTGNPAGGTFSGTGVTGNVFNPSIAGPGNWTITYTYIDANTCSGTSTTNILVQDCGCANPAQADAGPDQEICNGADATLSGTVNTTAVWTTSGTGNFSNPNSANTDYSPSTADVNSGSVTITLTATDPDGAGPCSAASDQLILTFVNINVNINPVADICLNDLPITLTATPAGGTWTGSGVTGNIFDPSVAGVGTAQLLYEFDNGNGCSDAESLAINVLDCGCPDPAHADAGPDQIVCPDEIVTLSGIVNNAATWTTNGSGTFSDPNNVNTTYTPGAADITAGSVVIILMDSDPDGQGPCSGATDQMIITFSNIDINISPVAILCVADPGVVLNATPAGGIWSGTGINGNTFEPGVAGSGSFSITYTFTDANNCSASESIIINVEDCDCPNPATANAGSDLIVCGNQLILLNGNTSNGPTWTTSGTGNFDNPNANLTIYNASQADILSGGVTLTITAADPDGAGPCGPASDDMKVTFVNELTVVANTVPELCESGLPVVLSGIPAGGVWSGTGVTGNTFDPGIAGLGSFQITYTVDDGNCKGEDIITIVVSNSPTVKLDQIGPFCVGDPSFILNQGSPAGGNYYLDADLTNPVTTFDPSIAGTYTITYIYGSGNCSGQAVMIVIVDDCGCPNPVNTDAGPDQTGCAGSNFNLSGSIINALGGIWSTSGDGTFDEVKKIDPVYTPGPADIAAGSVIITLTSEDPDGAGPCNPVSNTLTITITNLPVINIVSVTELCVDDAAVTLNATPVGGVFTGSGVTGAAFNPSAAGVGDHWIYYSAGVTPCTAIDSILISVKDCGCSTVVNVSAGNDTIVCGPGPISVSGVISGVNTGTWTSDGNGAFTNNNALNTIYTPTSSDFATGLVTLTLTSSDPDGAGPCKAVEDKMTITLLPLPEVILLVTQPSCVQNKGSVKISIISGQNLQFSIDNGVTFTNQEIINDLDPGNYQLIIKNTAFDCESNTDFNIKPFVAPEALWDVISSACTEFANNSIILESSENLVLPFQLKLNGVLYPTVKTLPFVIDGLDAGTFKVEITDTRGCTLEKEFIFTESSNIDIKVNGVYIINKGESVVLQPEIKGDYSMITWTPADYLSCDDCESPIAKPDENITYTIKVSDDQGCGDEAQIEIRIRKQINIFIPNAISPNHDGINDYFTVFADENVKIIRKMKIFNRWGGQVFARNDFEPNQESLGWDGRFREKEENPMVFVYYVELEMVDGEIQIFKGDVTILK